MAPRKSAKKAPTKAATKAAAKAAPPEEPTPSPEEFFDASQRVIPSLDTVKNWPERIFDKHRARHAAIREAQKDSRQAKIAKMAAHGVPPEKRSL